MRISSGNPHEDEIGFCRAVKVGNRVLVSGISPGADHGEVPPDAAGQARRCLEVMADALEQAGACMQDVVRTRVYLTDRNDLWPVGRVHGEFLGKVRPACSVVVVHSLLHPAWKVLIEAEAEIGQD